MSTWPEDSRWGRILSRIRTPQNFTLLGLLLGLARPLSAQDATGPSPTASPPLAAPSLPPLSAQQRANWLATATGRAALTGSLFSAAWGSLVQSPAEYGQTGEGFGLRYRNSLAGVAIANGIEASLGAWWGEDPRYLPLGGNWSQWRRKTLYSIRYTFLARNRHGRPMPAWARLIGNISNNWMSHAWRPPSERTTSRTLLRIGYGFAGRLTANAIREFLPALRSTQPVKEPRVPGSGGPPSASESRGP